MSEILNPSSSGLKVGTTLVAGGVTGEVLIDNAGVLGQASGIFNDPLFLTQGLDVTVTDPIFEGNPNYNRAVQFTATYDKLISNAAFTDQSVVGIDLEFKAGLNVFNSDPQANAQAKYTPIALNVGGNFIGAGEKFTLALTSNFWSMGDSFMFSGNTVYAGGPIAGDEGQGWSPQMQLGQPNGAVHDTITAVVRTTYSATITSPVVGSQIPQAIPVSTTVGASIGDWIVINQSVPGNNSAIWAAQITAINPSVSITCICPINCAIGTTITPALCLNMNNGGFQYGEGRVLVNYSGTSYSTGTISSIVGGAFNGSGTTWTNTMVGGNALNIGAIYLDIDTLTLSPFSVSLPCRSVYQINTIVNPTELGAFSTSVAADLSYRGRGVGQTGLTYKIIPGARVLLVNPITGGLPTFTAICETSTHTWTVGDTVECTVCPYPDVHGWDYVVAQWNAGGNRRFAINLLNAGARTFDTGINFSGQPTFIGNPANPGYDGFSFATGVNFASCKNPIVILTATSSDGTSIVAGSAIQINSPFGDGADTAIEWTGHAAGKIVQSAANNGFDWAMGNGALFRSIGPASNIDTHSPQYILQGYLQLCGFGAQQPYLRMGGTPGAGDSITGTFDLALTTDGLTASNTLQFSINAAPAQGLFGVTSGGSGLFAGANVPAITSATAGVNQRSQVLQLTPSVWNGSAAALKPCDIVAVPDSASATNTTVSLQFWIWDQVGNNFGQPNVPFAISSLGLIKFGKDNLIAGGDTRVTLDPSDLTAPRAITVPDVAGGLGVVVPGSHTPASAGAAGTPGTIEQDGSFVYICIATNSWISIAQTPTFGAGGGGGLVVGSTTITGGTPGDALYDNAGVLGETAGGGVDTDNIMPVKRVASGTYTALTTDQIIVATGTPVTINLLAAPSTGQDYVVKNGTSGGTVTVSGNGHTIDGAASASLGGYESRRYNYNGTEWSIL
jgi:hypothetical protein